MRNYLITEDFRKIVTTEMHANITSQNPKHYIFEDLFLIQSPLKLVRGKRKQLLITLLRGM